MATVRADRPSTAAVAKRRGQRPIAASPGHRRATPSTGWPPGRGVAQSTSHRLGAIDPWSGPTRPHSVENTGGYALGGGGMTATGQRQDVEITARIWPAEIGT
jgi:hypothetical protein